jgi:DNA sulfur modification protein DndB
MTKSANSLFPSLRAIMGDWVYYVTTMTLSDISARIKPVEKIKEKEDLRKWLQRKLTKKRRQEISQYLLTQPQHFFNAIVAGIFMGEPEWYPVTVGESPTLDEIELDERTQTAFGLLRLSGEEEIFAIDGQHRVEGIKVAVHERAKIGSDEQCVIFVAHRATEDGRERTRRLFSTLNRYAKPVSKGEIIALSEDDAFAIVTRRLIYSYPPLSIRKGFVKFTTTTNIPPDNKTAITTALALYDMVQIMAVPKGSHDRAKLKIGPADSNKVQEIFEGHRNFWKALRKYIPEIEEVTDSKPQQRLASRYRTEEGGHLLFRPFGQKAFASAVRIMMDRGVSLSSAVHELSRTPLDLRSDPWPGILWNPIANKVIWGNDTLAQNLFLYMVGQELPPKSKNSPYNIAEEYRKALGDPMADIERIPITK